jgi:hypothetical protein
LLGSFFDPENGGDMFLRKVGCLSPDYPALYPRRQYSLEEGSWDISYSIYLHFPPKILDVIKYVFIKLISFSKNFRTI